jgi:hypothetical protein
MNAKGKRQGKGVYYFKNGDIYEGMFAESLFHGKGKLVAKQSGDIYDGMFANDKFYGFGVYTYGSGDKY